MDIFVAYDWDMQRRCFLPCCLPSKKIFHSRIGDSLRERVTFVAHSSSLILLSPRSIAFLKCNENDSRIRRRPMITHGYASIISIADTDSRRLSWHPDTPRPLSSPWYATYFTLVASIVAARGAEFVLYARAKQSTSLEVNCVLATTKILFSSRDT